LSLNVGGREIEVPFLSFPQFSYRGSFFQKIEKEKAGCPPPPPPLSEPEPSVGARFLACSLLLVGAFRWATRSNLISYGPIFAGSHEGRPLSFFTSSPLLARGWSLVKTVFRFPPFPPPRSEWRNVTRRLRKATLLLFFTKGPTDEFGRGLCTPTLSFSPPCKAKMLEHVVCLLPLLRPISFFLSSQT